MQKAKLTYREVESTSIILLQFSKNKFKKIQHSRHVWQKLHLSFLGPSQDIVHMCHPLPPLPFWKYY